MLDIRNLSAGYGHGPVIDDLSLSIAQGETVAVLGPNGAGKSTLVNALSATLPLRKGQVLLEGSDLMALTSDAIVRRGLVQVPEGRRMFAPMSVLDNLMLGSITLPGGKQAADEQLQRVYELFPRLAERRHQAAGTLSGGEQQMVAIGRALMSKPRLLLLDEPFLGIAPRVVEEILQSLDVLRGEGLTLLLVEQKLDIALPFTQRAVVLIKGRIALQQTSAELARRDNLESLYFELADEVKA
ncbi:MULTISPECIES: ABC transporter ATP-binding protein [unclassified Pseudomonas]|jgi:branched-chain amino acid transport system ATP-binding protein|uniref:ABC transporter ATP-binding protein n=1 Tax=unclassified Pseudomonas TaxID=196821 RepID=UPI00069D040A|nr:MULTISPECIES: ABC transporter ATP-binding protein [unclassified Pseudomonas]WPN44723.1 ABC transporter ATP-binding protein [Pseudomonas sp. P8_241]